MSLIPRAFRLAGSGGRDPGLVVARAPRTPRVETELCRAGASPAKSEDRTSPSWRGRPRPRTRALGRTVGGGILFPRGADFLRLKRLSVRFFRSARLLPSYNRLAPPGRAGSQEPSGSSKQALGWRRFQKSKMG